jgi:replicative DNA helicase
MALNSECSPVEFLAKDVWVRGIVDLLVLDGDKARIVDYKGLALDTKLPTPTGFTTMGDVKVGDVLFAENGEQCTVTGKSEVKNLRCYKITFDDTSSVVCDEEHLWKLTNGKVIGVHELMGKRNAKQRVWTPKISVAAPLATEDATLPIDPYVLGIWLADGKHTSGEVTKPDAFIWEEIQRRGFYVNMETGGRNRACPQRTIHGLAAKLREVGLLGNKHIPSVYLRAGYQQRLDLLRGLMDGDGSANPTRKQAVYSTVNLSLANQIAELLCSLGQRPLVNTVLVNGFGKDVIAHPISFRPIGINPFLLPRKADRIDPAWGSGASGYRIAVSVEEIESVPTQCITVDSPDHTFLCTERMIPTHNSGGAKYPDKDQLELMSLMVFAHFPEVQEVKAALLFLNHNVLVKALYKRENKDKLWRKWEEGSAALDAAFDTNVWSPNPSPLCRWCVVEHCEHHMR